MVIESCEENRSWNENEECDGSYHTVCADEAMVTGQLAESIPHTCSRLAWTPLEVEQRVSVPL